MRIENKAVNKLGQIYIQNTFSIYRT